MAHIIQIELPNRVPQEKLHDIFNDVTDKVHGILQDRELSDESKIRIGTLFTSL
jgi:hypothetical protein